MSERLWFKIGEASALVGASPKELRYWERVIPELKPRRSKGNLRYYHQDELAKLQRIRQWLSEGFTVADCRELLNGNSVQAPRVHRLESSTESLPKNIATVLAALRTLQERLCREAGEPPEPPTAAPGRRQSATPKPEKLPPVPKPSKREPKPNPELPALGRMWSQGRLPLDWEE